MTSAAKQVGVRELRGKLSEYLRKAEAGETFVVVSRGKTLAELRPPEPREDIFRKPGALKGQIWIADDFDDLPEDILDAFEADFPV